jgi:hypothetical protein
VAGVSGPVQQARLRLHQTTDPSSGLSIEIHASDVNGWSESTLQGNNAPPPAGLLANFNGPVPSGATIVFDLDPSALSGDGIYSLIISSPSGNDAWFGSSESSIPPVLEVSVENLAPPQGQPFSCYKARTSRGAPKPPLIPALRLEDAFEDKLFDAKKPTSLCVPAETWHAGTLSPVLDASTHLESYRIRQSASLPQDKFDRNDPKHQSIRVFDQFGAITVDLVKPEHLLVPSAICDPKAELCPPDASQLDLALIGSDHFKCYRVRITRRAAAFSKRLRTSGVDRFQERVYKLKSPKSLCAPANKDGGDPLAASDPLHLMCYSAKAVKQYCSQDSPPGFALQSCGNDEDCDTGTCVQAAQRKHVRVLGVQAKNLTQLSPEILDTVSEEHVCVPALRSP